MRKSDSIDEKARYVQEALDKDSYFKEKAKGKYGPEYRYGSNISKFLRERCPMPYLTAEYYKKEFLWFQKYRDGLLAKLKDNERRLQPYGNVIPVVGRLARDLRELPGLSNLKLPHPFSAGGYALLYWDVFVWLWQQSGQWFDKDQELHARLIPAGDDVHKMIAGAVLLSSGWSPRKQKSSSTSSIAPLWSPSGYSLTEIGKWFSANAVADEKVYRTAAKEAMGRYTKLFAQVSPRKWNVDFRKLDRIRASLDYVPWRWPSYDLD